MWTLLVACETQDKADPAPTGTIDDTAAPLHTGPTTSPTTPTTLTTPTSDTGVHVEGCADEVFSDGFRAEGSTEGAGDDLASCNRIGAGSPDLVYAFVVPETARYHFGLSSDYNAVLGIYDTCGPAPTVALCGTDQDRELTAGQVVYVGVDGQGRNPDGSFVLDVFRILPEETDCTDDVDGDVDGDLDCLDADCAGDPSCGVCPDGVLVAGVPLALDLVGETDDLEPGCAYEASSDVGWTFEAPRAGTYAFAVLTDDGFGSVLAVTDGCGGATLGCGSYDYSPNHPHSRIVLDLADGQVVTAVVEGIFGDVGDFELAVAEVLPEDCHDGVDQDLDLRVDCADPECATDAACMEDCGNGLDDDANGAADCADLGCDLDPSCLEVCDDGLDDDGDGFVDCADRSCSGFDGCIENCTAFVDDDGDDLVDCADPNCNGVAPCGVELCDFFFRDEDADGTIDCRDPDCDNAAACMETCNNGYDDTYDNFTDCSDPDCHTDPLCAEDCGNGVDDDADYLVDCNDTSCVGDPACPDDCPAHVWTAGVPGVVFGTTEGRASGWVVPCLGYQNGSPDDTWTFTAPADGTYTFDTWGSAFDTALHLHASCDRTTWLVCNDDTPPTLTSEVSLRLAAGESVLVVVDSNGYPPDRGEYVLRVH
jgi:hypothetical protein